MRTLVSLAAATIVTSMDAAASTTPVKPDVAARAYVQMLYDRYEGDDGDGVLGDNESQFFDASTLALLRQDQKLLNGEESVMASDPLCRCQDSGSMHAAIGNVAMTGANAAKADVAVQFVGKPVSHVIIELAFENGAWRLHDIDSLRDELTKEIAELSAHH